MKKKKEGWKKTFPPSLPNGEPAWYKMRGTQAGRPATEEDMTEESRVLYASFVPPAEAKN